MKQRSNAQAIEHPFGQQLAGGARGGSGRGTGGRGCARGGHLRQTGGVGMLQRHASSFGLDDHQVDQLEALKTDHELEKVDLRAAARKARIRLRALMRDHDSKEADVLAAIDAVCGCDGELRRMRFRHLQAARAVLSAEQRQQVRRFHHRQQVAKADSFRASLHASDNA